MRLHPELQRFLRSMKTEGGQDFAAEMSARVQAHMDAQNVARTAQAAQDQFVGKMSSLKSNLVSMARNDPTSHDLALDLADISMRHLSNAHGASQEAHDALLGGMQSDIAHAAVEGLAGVSADAARSALSSGRLADLLPDPAKAGLSQYIDNMAATRQVDATARQAEVARQHIQMSSQAASEWLGGMTHPTTGQLWFPDNWGQRMLQDQRLSPNDKAALQTTYRNLLQNGNPAQSDPTLVSGLLSRAALPHNDPNNPSAGEVLAHAGGGLTLADAQFIAGRSGPQAPEVDQSTSRIADVLGDARQQIGNQSAFGRFVNWLLPAVRAGASLDPNAKEYALTPERMATFQPTGDDVIAPAIASMAGGARASLGDIFGGLAKGFSDVGRAGIEATNDFLSGTQSGPATAMMAGVQQVATPLAMVPGGMGVLGPSVQVLSGTADHLMNDQPGVPPNQMTTPEGQTYNPDTDA